jgi:hypothetical protein
MKSTLNFIFSLIMLIAFASAQSQKSVCLTGCNDYHEQLFAQACKSLTGPRSASKIFCNDLKGKEKAECVRAKSVTCDGLKGLEMAACKQALRGTQCGDAASCPAYVSCEVQACRDKCNSEFRIK